MATKIQIYIERIDSPWHQRWITRSYGSIDTFLRYGAPKADATYRLEINSIERPYAAALSVWTVKMIDGHPILERVN